MNLLRASVSEIVGLFLDDEFLAIAALIVVGASELLIKLHVNAMAAGILFAGCVAALLASVWRTVTAARK